MLEFTASSSAQSVKWSCRCVMPKQTAGQASSDAKKTTPSLELGGLVPVREPSS